MAWRFAPENKHYRRAVAALQAAEYPPEFLGPSLAELIANHPDVMGAALRQAAADLKIGARWGAAGDLRTREFVVTAGATISERKAQLREETIRLAGEHPAGTRLPTTYNLGKAFGFSNGIVKSVFASLIAEGTLVSGGGAVYLAHPADPARQKQMSAAAARAAQPRKPNQWNYSNPHLTTEALRALVNPMDVGGVLPSTRALRPRLETLLDLAPGALGDGAINMARAQLAQEGILERGGAANSPSWRIKAKEAQSTPPTSADPDTGPAPALAAVVRLMDDPANQGLSLYEIAALTGHSDNLVLQAMAMVQLRDDLEGLVLGTSARPGEIANERLKAYDAAKYLIQQMRAGELDPDGIFPTQAEVAKTLKMGPAPVKVALATIGQELGCGAQYRTGYEATMEEIAELADLIDEPNPREAFRQLIKQVTLEFPKGTKLPGVRELANGLPMSKVIIEQSLAELRTDDNPMLVSLKGGERGGLFTAVGEPTEAAMLFSQSATTDPEVASEPSAYFATTRVTVSGTGTLSNIFGKEVIPAFPVKRFTRTRH